MLHLHICLLEDHKVLLSDRRVLNNSLDAVNKDHNALMEDHIGLLEDHKILLSDRRVLKENHDLVFNDHTKVVSDLSSVLQQHAALQGLLQDNKDDLWFVLLEKETLATELKEQDIRVNLKTQLVMVLRRNEVAASQIQSITGLWKATAAKQRLEYHTLETCLQDCITAPPPVPRSTTHLCRTKRPYCPEPTGGSTEPDCHPVGKRPNGTILRDTGERISGTKTQRFMFARS